MAVYSELIKNFEKIREYVRDFYIFGFHTREKALTQKASAPMTTKSAG